VIPLVRPNEALLALVVRARAGGVPALRARRRHPTPFLPSVDVPLAVFLLMATVWPLTSLTLRGQIPTGEEYASILPMAKLVGIYFLVRTRSPTTSRSCAPSVHRVARRGWWR